MNNWSQPLSFLGPILFWLVLIWSLIWKGLAFWKAVVKHQVLWFGIFLGVNTLGILEILYLFWLARFPIIDNEKVLGFLNDRVGEKVKTA